VIAAAFQTFAGYDPHPEPFDKAAMLLRGIIQGHPFNDGNKRSGFLLALYYLHHFGFRLPRRLPEDAKSRFARSSLLEGSGVVTRLNRN
jgi:death-on-curing protein